MTNEQVSRQFEVHFNGAHHGQDDDLLNPPQAGVTAQVEGTPAVHRRADLADARQLLLSLLSERSIWTLKGLRASSELAPRDFWDSIQGLKRHGLIWTPDRGLVGLVR